MNRTLSVIFTSDTHGYVYPTDYIASGERPMGLLRIASIAAMRDENALYLDGGDTIQGSPLTYYCVSRHQPLPVAALMKHARLDYYTLGNHDFNNGYDYLLEYMNALDARCVCANVRDLTGRAPILPWDVRVMPNGLRVGITGVVTDWVNVWERPENLTNWRITDAAEAAREASAALRAQHVDLALLICHGGFEDDLKTGHHLSDTTENQACRIARECDFDCIFTGHQHIEQEGVMLSDTLVCQPPANAVQYIRAELTPQGPRSARLVRPEQPADAALSERWRPFERALDRFLDAPLGRLNMALRPGDKLQMALHGSPVATFFNMVQLDAMGAEISGTCLANDIRGFDANVTVRDVVSTYVYANTLVVKRLDAAAMKAVLERCAAYFDVRDGQIRISEDFLKPKVAHYNYDFFLGVEYEFDLNRPVGDRVTKLTIGGKPYTDTHTVVMNNYRATGSGGYDVLRSCPTIREDSTSVSEWIIRYLDRRDCVTVPAESSFSVRYC